MRAHVDRLLRAAESLLGWLGAMLLAAFLAIVLIAVVVRYVAGGGLVWAEEVAVWLNVTLIAVGSPLAAGSALAMRLDVFTRMLPAPLRGAAAACAEVITLVAGLVLALGGAAIVGTIGGTSTVLGLPEWLRYAAIAGGGVLTVLVALGRCYVEAGARRALIALATSLALYAATRHLAGPVLSAPSAFAGAVALAGILAGAPLPHTFLVAVAAAQPVGSMLPEPAIVQNVVVGVGKFLLLAIPFFLLAGGLLTTGGLAGRLVRFAGTLVGHRRGGLAQTALLTSVLFSGASGSSIANAAFGAKVLVPPLVAQGYARPRATAIVAANAVLDNIIPPSIAFLILASVTTLSVGSLLVGGLVAGLALAVALGAAIHVTSRADIPIANRATATQRVQSLIAALPAIGLGVIVVAGIRFGVATTTEASALAAAYALVVSLTLGSVTPGGLGAAFRQAAAEAAAVGLLIGSAAPFAFLLAVDRAAEGVTSFVTLLGNGPLAVMLLANLVLLLAGLLLDIGAAIVLLAPLLLPAAIAAGIDPVHFGVILVVNLMIHGLTPPLGILVYVASGVAGTRPALVFREALPLLAALLVALTALAGAAALAPLLRVPAA